MKPTLIVRNVLREQFNCRYFWTNKYNTHRTVKTWIGYNNDSHKMIQRVAFAMFNRGIRDFDIKVKGSSFIVSIPFTVQP